ncbi:hypothetical protein ACFVJK_42745 [Streptomyces sp. NPDC127172]|uniref:hypothetical protein n=1 Tax=Streptomyces sp. NPDC127172 TaxID=3345382 RepID=UPI003638FFBD
MDRTITLRLAKAGHLAKASHNGEHYEILRGYALLDAHRAVEPLSGVATWQKESSVRSWLPEQALGALQELLSYCCEFGVPM